MQIISSGCVLFTKVTSPVSSCVRRAALISVDIPPITLTPSRTAIERQLIGENREIEPDGWMVASTRNTSEQEQSDTDSSLKDTKMKLAREYYREIGVLEFYSDIVREYKGMALLGESQSGYLEMVPATISGRSLHQSSGEEIENSRRVMEEVNHARSRINQIVRELEGTQLPWPNQLERDPYHHSHAGEWTMNNSKKWSRTP